MIFFGFCGLPEENAPARGGDRAPDPPRSPPFGGLGCAAAVERGGRALPEEEAPDYDFLPFWTLPEENAPPRGCARAPDPAFPTIGKPWMRGGGGNLDARRRWTRGGGPSQKRRRPIVIFTVFWGLPEESALARGGDRAPDPPAPHHLGNLDARRRWKRVDGPCQKKRRPITISGSF